MNATRADIVTLLREGRSNSAIARELRCDKHRVADIRRDLGIPNVEVQPLSLEEKWRTKVHPVEGGHLEWRGGRQTASGTPVLRYKEQLHTAAAVAFRIRYGRDPEGYVFAECGFNHCVAPDHVDDAAARRRTREQLRYLSGKGARPDVCAHGHDQAVEGRYTSDGRAYCEECKREAKPREVSRA
ncbi:hypothetical protein [Streptomyces chryseus]